jgi:hypothetical protein
MNFKPNMPNKDYIYNNSHWKSFILLPLGTKHVKLYTTEWKTEFTFSLRNSSCSH